MSVLDAAGIVRAVVLSVGYSFADERKKLDDPDRLTRVENDWTAARVAASGGRLIGFCSPDPLRRAALDELQRCLASLAEHLRAPVLVHMRARGGLNFGGEDARIFLDRLVIAAPSIEIVVARGPAHAQPLLRRGHRRDRGVVGG